MRIMTQRKNTTIFALSGLSGLPSFLSRDYFIFAVPIEDNAHFIESVPVSSVFVSTPELFMSLSSNCFVLCLWHT